MSRKIRIKADQIYADPNFPRLSGWVASCGALFDLKSNALRPDGWTSGMRIRLKANVDISTYSVTNQVILKAMKKYGLILADIGSDMYISGAPDERWNNDDLQKSGKIKAGDFEVVQIGVLH